MKKLILVALSALSLTACKVGPFDITASYSIDNEVVFSTTNTIDEIPGIKDPANAEYTKTKYPLVFVHGLFGFDDIFGVNYWYRVVEAIELGGGTAFTVPVPKLNTTETRGEHLIASLEELQATLGEMEPGVEYKFHLVGHSHGGPTTRYVIRTRPDLIASVTTVGGLNVYGVDFLDEHMTKFKHFLIGPVAQGMFNALAEIIELAGGNKQNHQSFAIGAAESLSDEGIRLFNQTHNDGLPAGWDQPKEVFKADHCFNGTDVIDGDHFVEIEYPQGSNEYHKIRMMSFSGTGIETNKLDPLDLLMKFANGLLNDGPGDGFVDQCASHFGEVIRSDFDLNHLDQINHTFALRRATTTNPLITYRLIANKLKAYEIDL